MRTPLVIAATLTASALLCAQGNGNGNGKELAPNNIHRIRGASGSTGSGNSGPVLLNYNGGPVMLGQTHVYYIYYGNWSVDTSAAGILNNFANNLIGSGWFNILTQYYSDSSSPSYISNSVILSGSTTSTYVAANPTNLTDSDIWGIVTTAINNHSLQSDPNGVYFVLTAPGVGESSGFLTTYCGWHTAATLNNTWIKYAFVGDAGNNSGCSVQFGSSPNNDPPVDAMISVVAHELSEAVTDPLLDAWYDSTGEEVADKCAWTFGTTFSAPNGSTANITLGAFDFLIQQEFSNASDSCVMTYATAPNYTLTVSPASQSANQGATTGNYTVTVNASNGFNSGVTLSVSGLPAGATANAFSPNPATTTATFTVNAGTAAPGSYPFTITGISGSLNHTTTATLVIAQPDFGLAVSPTTQTVTQGATTAQAYAVTVNPINGFVGTPTLSVTGNPSGSTVAWTSNSFTVATTSSTAPGSYTLTIKGVSGSLSHTTTATLVVSPVGTFTVSITPASLTVKRKSSGKYTVTVTALNGFNAKVTFTVTGLPSHASASFSPTSITGSGSTTLTVSAPASTSTGTDTLTVTGTSGTVTSSAHVSLTVD